MPRVVFVLRGQSYLSTLLTFPLLSPPVHPVMSDKVLHEKDKENVTESDGSLHSEGTIYVKLIYRHQRRGASAKAIISGVKCSSPPLKTSETIKTT